MIQVYEDQSSIRDETCFGRTPLGVAAAAGPGTTAATGNQAGGSAGPNRDETAATTANMKLLIDEFPHTVQMVDDMGRYPLHLAVISGFCWKDGIERLFDSYPQALGIRDPITGLYPFQIGATVTAASNRTSQIETAGGRGRGGTELQGLSNVYRLLRADPSLVLRGVN